ncbi:MAG: phytoene dehydrogenase-like protein [Bradymonadia bacterium]|jgi:phytoene dehydrogenase-like protein
MLHCPRVGALFALATPQPSPMSHDVIIVGAGLAGLCCARALVAAGVTPLLLEASDAPGGRLRTDDVDGFLLDRGFQVLLTAYPEAQRQLDYAALDLRTFESGAQVRVKGRFHDVADPLRHPSLALGTAAAPVGSIADKLNVLKLRQRVTRGEFEAVFAQPEKATVDALRDDYGFSATMIDRFFRPFFGGIMLERELGASRRMFDFVYRMLVEGETAIPALGIQQIPRQLASGLPAGVLVCESRVSAVTPSSVTLESGETLNAKAVVVAVEGPAAQTLVPAVDAPRSIPVTCLYFDAPAAPSVRSVLMLDGDGKGPVNNLCVPSNLSSTFAPSGRHLVSATVLGPRPDSMSDLEAAARVQLTRWFGREVTEWNALPHVHIAHAQPGQSPPRLSTIERPQHIAGVWVCGDHQDTASIQGAMVSGRRAAEAVAEALS